MASASLLDTNGLPLPLQGRIRSKLCRRQMIEGFYEACSDKCLGHDFRREEPALPEQHERHS